MLSSTAPQLADDDPASGYVSAKLRGDWIGGGQRGVFAVAPFARGELIAVWGGKIMPGSLVGQLGNLLRCAVQVEEDLFLVSSVEGPSDWINHSCEPNAGLSGQLVVVALRDIQPGEQICYDYAMSDGLPYDEFDCNCGERACRGRVTGDDWQRPELQLRYSGHFSPYLERRMAALRARP